MKTIYADYLNAWVALQKATKAVDEIKAKIVNEIPEDGISIGDYKLMVRSRPIFTKVSLDEARKYNAVKKVVNTTVLNAYLKKGKKIKGVDYTKYVTVHSTF